MPARLVLALVLLGAPALSLAQPGPDSEGRPPRARAAGPEKAAGMGPSRAKGRGMGRGRGLREGRGRGMGGGPHGPRRLLALAERIGVSDKTRKQIEKIVFDAAEQGIALRAERDRARLELTRALSADKPDEATVMAKADALGAAQTALRKHRLRTLLRLRALLTSKQRAKLRGLMGGSFGEEP